MMGESISEETSIRLHERLLSGDVTAPAKIAEKYLVIIIRRLSSRFRNIDDPHIIETAAEDALLNYFERPEQYDPSKLELEHYLWMSAKYDLLNILAKSKRESLPGSISNIVELDDPSREYHIGDTSSLSVEERVEILTSPLWEHLRSLVPDPIDFAIVVLMMEGIRRTKDFSKILGISDLPLDEQAKIVKRHKDRLKKTLQRNLDPKELRSDD